MLLDPSVSTMVGVPARDCCAQGVAVSESDALTVLVDSAEDRFDAARSSESGRGLFWDWGRLGSDRESCIK